jgi:ATP-dependent Clp protease ATP-binding subunit ClpA
MLQIKERNNKTILGYHDKNSNHYSLIEDELPILNEEDYSPFIITDKYHFSISTKDIVTLINNYKAINSFNKIKIAVAQILIIPGLIISILYTLKAFGLFDNIDILINLLSNNLVNLTFWISILGVTILWHDYYRTKSHPVKLPIAGRIDEKTLMSIKNSGIKFSKYSVYKAIHYLDEDSQEILVGFTTSSGLRTFNLFERLLKEESVQSILKRADLKLPIEHLNDFNINEETIPPYAPPGIRSLVIYAIEEALLTNSPQIKPEHFFLAFMKVFPVLQDYINKSTSSTELLREIVWYEVEKERKAKSANYFNINQPYRKTGGVAKEWVYGYTFVLGKFSKDITQKISMSRDKFGIGHDREVEELVSVMGRLSKNNALLIGEPGVGKSSLIKGLAQRINHGDVPSQLSNRRIIQLDLNSLIAFASSTPDKNIEALIQKAMDELANAGNVILFIDEIQETIPAKAEESGHSIAGILLPYIVDGTFPIVGTINYYDYKKYFYSSESLRQSFESIEVSELSPSDTLKILETKIPSMESNYGLYVTLPALTAAIELSQRYITERKLPDSAVGTIEAAASWAQSQGIKELNHEHVARSVSLQTNVPVESITAEEATKLINLEQNIRSRVIGQDEAVHAVVESIKRARTDIRDPNKPIGVFLFLGPTGTGKTHLSKVLSDEFFNEEDMVRVDMSEYQEISSIDKILGSQETTFGQGQVTLLDKVKSKPFSVVLFDEIEKAHPQILDLFLQLFDEGRLTSNNGETINFTNTIIIATSNIGSKNLLDALERDRSMWEEAKQSALLELRGSLRPEMINRFDQVIVFQPHNINNLVEITSLLLNQLAMRIGEKGISLEWNESIPMIVANSAQQPGMGARPIKRFIQDKIETKIADEILINQVTTGGVIEISESWLQ